MDIRERAPYQRFNLSLHMTQHMTQLQLPTCDMNFSMVQANQDGRA